METIDFLRRVHAGDTIDETVSLAGYPAGDGWTLKIILTSAQLKYVLTGTADRDAHSIDAAGTYTANWEPGKYRWVAFVTKNGDRQRISSGEIQILPNIEEAAADLRTHAEKVLDAIEALLEGKATTDDMYTAVGNKILSRYSYNELMSLRARYRNEVAQERKALKRRQGKPAANQIRVRFK